MEEKGQFVYTLMGYSIIAVVCLVGTLCFGLLMAGLVRFVATHHLEGIVVRWGPLTGTTAILFWYLIKTWREYWHQKIFWYVMLGALVLHIAFFVVILRAVDHWRLAWFYLLYTPEFAIITAILFWAQGRFRKHHRRR